MIHIEVLETGSKLRIEQELWITMNRNGPVVTPHRHKALGVGDGVQVWSLGKLKGFPMAKLITLAEYEQALMPHDPDPELCAEEALKIMMGGSYEIE